MAPLPPPAPLPCLRDSTGVSKERAKARKPKLHEVMRSASRADISARHVVRVRVEKTDAFKNATREVREAMLKQAEDDLMERRKAKGQDFQSKVDAYHAAEQAESSRPADDPPIVGNEGIPPSPNGPVANTSGAVPRKEVISSLSSVEVAAAASNLRVAGFERLVAGLLAPTPAVLHATTTTATGRQLTHPIEHKVPVQPPPPTTNDRPNEPPASKPATGIKLLSTPPGVPVAAAVPADVDPKKQVDALRSVAENLLRGLNSANERIYSLEAKMAAAQADADDAAAARHSGMQEKAEELAAKVRVLEDRVAVLEAAAPANELPVVVTQVVRLLEAVESLSGRVDQGSGPSPEAGQLLEVLRDFAGMVTSVLGT